MTRRGRALPLALAILCGACDGALTPAALEAAASACPEAPRRPLPGEAGGLVLVNAYWLQEEAARAVRRGDPAAPRVEEALGEAARMGARLVRTNAFNDDPAKAGDSAIQVGPLVYDEVALRGLDLVLARARAHGVRLVLTLGNFWDAYGGARQYVAWAGLPAPVTGDPRFFSHRAVVDHYRAHLAALLGRVSTADGLRYGDHPAVAAWELLNEPRAAPADLPAYRAWAGEVAAHVRGLAPGRLVGTGGEGIDPALLAVDLETPAVDYASLHLYPELLGQDGLLAARSGARAISAAAAAARAGGKPVVVAELGLLRDGLDQDGRRAVYRGWLACARRAGAAAAGPWMLAHDDRPDAWDPFQFKWWDGTAPADPRNAYVDLLAEAAAAW